MKKRGLFAMAATVLLVSSSVHAADIVFGDFETGFDDFAPRQGSILSTSTQFGVTRGLQSLAVNRNATGFWGLASSNVISVSRDNFLAATSVSFDLTMLASQLGSDGATFEGFAQVNEFVINDTGGAFVQRNFGSGLGTDTFGRNGQWGGQDGTRTLTWNLDNYPAPPSAPGLTYKQHLTNNPQITGVVFWVPVQAGGTGVSSSATFYFDNWRFSTPDAFLKGDFNFDGEVLDSDISLFVSALTGDFASLIAQFPTRSEADFTFIGDFNGDGEVLDSDITGFVAALLGGGGRVGVIPEPAALGLLAPMGLLVARRRR